MNARPLALSSIGAALALALGLTAAQAATPTASNVFSLRQQNSANASNFATGDIMVWGAINVLPPAGLPDATVWAYSANCPIGASCGSLATDPDWFKQRLYPCTLR
eukprot:Opistho-2@47076